MSALTDELAIPDSDVLLHLLRMNSTGKALDAKYGLTTRREIPILSSVVEAELLSLVAFCKWSEKKVAALRSHLSRLVRVDAGHPDIIAAYVELYCEARRAGRYKQFRQNDLWIAATARAAGAVVYTCNGRDFDWIDPTYVNVVQVDQTP